MTALNRWLVATAVAGWAGCAAVMGIGRSVTTQDNALIIHAIAAPAIFAVLSFGYFQRTGVDRVLFTALFFTVFAMAVDFFFVALLILRSLDMFASVLGTWIPFALIFASTYLTGRVVAGRRSPAIAPEAVG